MNVVCMDAARPARGGGLSVLSLDFVVLDGRPDWPAVQVLVAGEDPFADVAPEWRGFDPEDILGTASPLLPTHQGRRVAIYQCSCGSAGCGVIAPLIVASPDRRRVSWVDFRNYVGVFVRSMEASADRYEGKPWDLPELHFDGAQYTAEVQRASRDRLWETRGRATARLLFNNLGPRSLVLPPDLDLRWAEPAPEEGAVRVLFQRVVPPPNLDILVQMLQLASTHHDPQRAADDMADQLLGTPPEHWSTTFGLDPNRLQRG